LRSFYWEVEVVELLCAIGPFNRFNNALQMEPTKPGEGGCATPATETSTAR
jgi:hypothetical protein